MWRGHSCPRTLTTSTDFHFETGPGISLESIGKARTRSLTIEARPSPMPTAILRRYEYRRRLRHYQRDDRPLFVTFRTLKSIQFTPQARTLAREHCIHDHGKTIRLHVAVIMPDHVHLLFTALRDAEGWTFALPEILRPSRGTQPARSTNCGEGMGLSGRTNPFTTCCGEMRVFGKQWSTFARIP